jgi:hypothetical protein
MGASLGMWRVERNRRGGGGGAATRAIMRKRICAGALPMLADFILIVHFLVVAFNVAMLPAIWMGALFRWEWVRIRWLRIVHVALMAFIALEALAGVTCPLTIWEDLLRGSTGAAEQRGFVSRWVAALLYWDWPAWVFTAIYTGWTVLIVITWFLVRPHCRNVESPPAR